MRQYELLAIFPGTLAEGALEEHCREAEGLLRAAGAEGVRRESSQRMRLAYPIAGVETGAYARFAFSIESAQVPPLQSKLKLLRGLLRSMITDYTPGAVSVAGRLEPVAMVRTAPAHTPPPKLTEAEIEKKVEEALAATEEQA